MNVTRKRAILASLALILVSSAIQPPSLQADAMLVLTENSSTSLTATLNGTGLSVTPVGGEIWQLTLPPRDMFLSGGLVYWHEPDPTLSVNTFIPFVSKIGSLASICHAGVYPNAVSRLR
jgi:hypothetical protein